MRLIAVLVIFLMPSFSLASEELVCTTIAFHDFEIGKPIDTTEIKEKSFISIDGDLLAINYENSAAQIFKLQDKEVHELLGVVARKFTRIKKFSLDVVVIGGKECSDSDKDRRSATWVSVIEDGYISEAMSCKCN